MAPGPLLPGEKSLFSGALGPLTGRQYLETIGSPFACGADMGDEERTEEMDAADDDDDDEGDEEEEDEDGYLIRGSL